MIRTNAKISLIRNCIEGKGKWKLKLPLLNLQLFVGLFVAITAHVHVLMTIDKVFIVMNKIKPTTAITVSLLAHAKDMRRWGGGEEEMELIAPIQRYVLFPVSMSIS